jgi:hypothetical protein
MPEPAAAPAVPERIGDHRLQLTDDILRIEVAGNLDVPRIDSILAVYQSCIDHFGYLLLVMDVHKSTGMDMAARRKAVQWGKDHVAVQRTAVVGAPFALRIFLGLMNRATQLLSQAPSSELTFCETEEQARAWLATQRPQVQPAAGR